MPTAARLFGALCFAILAFVASVAVVPYLPKDTPVGYMPLINAGIGVLVGWMIVGANAGQGYALALTNGLRGAVTIVFFSVLLFAGREMIIRSMHRLYHGPQDALQHGAGLMLEYALYLVNQTELAILILGGVLAGYIVEFVSHRWR
ncbi:MAG: TrgA family protein [Paracoccaceae bacterium]|nr:TrgA family protein [Paracoccaceae bacterium]